MKLLAQLVHRRMAILLLPFLPIMVGIVACSRHADQKDAEIRFMLSGAPAQSELRALRFYLHDVELLADSGAAQPFALEVLAPWQDGRVALVDLVGTANARVRGRVAANRYTGVRFTVGVPFDLNHGNPLTAAAPLNRGDMVWAWQNGHKFLRADLAFAGTERSFHLGSTGCSSASSLRPPTLPCAQPNIVRVELKGLDPLRAPIRLRVDRLAQAMLIEPGACTGNYAQDKACAAPFALTGLPHTGACGGVCAQQLFDVQ
jgi:uncharacterized repeat protein (TIGR04052 family)